MVCGVVPQPESCGTDSGTGEIPVFARFSILLYQCTKVTVNIRGASHPPSPHQATSIISSPYPLPPFGTVVRGTGLVLRPRTGPIFRLRPIPPSPLWYSGTWYRTMPSPPPRRVIYPIAGPIPSSCPGTAVLGTAPGDERDHTTAKHGKGEASTARRLAAPHRARDRLRN